MLDPIVSKHPIFIYPIPDYTLLYFQQLARVYYNGQNPEFVLRLSESAPKAPGFVNSDSVSEQLDAQMPQSTSTVMR